MTTLLIVIIVAGVAAVAWAADPWPSRRISQTLGRREEIDVEEVLAKHFAESETDLTAAADLWRNLAACFNVRPGQLRLSDRFAVELDSKRIFKIDDELSCVNVTLTNAASKRQIEVELSRLQTIEDCVTTLCASVPK